MLTEGVFDGIRVLDIGHVVAGPFVASVMADFGADVIKIEPPVRGDPLRWLYPKDDVGLFYKMQARNKKSVTLDLKHPEGRAIFERLAAQSDVVVENFRPGVMERLGLGWEELSKINERLIMCRLSGFGQTGPYAGRRAYGRIGEAFAGFAHITGEPDGPPTHSQMSVGDTVAGTWAAMGVMMALYWRDARGGGLGQVVDIGLYEGLFRQIEQQVVVLDQLGKVLERSGSNHRNVPFTGLFRTRDGGHYSFSAVTERSALDALRAMDMAEDERFNSFERCMQHRDEFAAAVKAWMAARTLAEVDAAFQARGAPGTPVKSAADLIDDPHILAREMVVTVEDKELGPLRMQGIVPKLSRTPGAVRHAGQLLGESNALVYGELLGITQAQIDDLQARGVI
jgi:crotonobetainyl-CoA:carnitine CoA-transferase CaiB-like acyl-CoA transferase